MPSASSIAPTTTHNLGTGDRARLIRSTRKIEAVVGETPQVADPSASKSRSTMVKALRNTLAPALPRLAPPPLSEGRPVLYLRVPSPPPDSILTLTTPAPSPTLTVAIKPPTRDDAARIRTMAKLRRTLGVNVPPDLVFPPENTNTPRYKRLTARTLPSAVRRDLREQETPWIFREVRKSGAESKRRSFASQRSRRKCMMDTDGESDISRGWVWVGKRDELPAHVKARRSRVESGLPLGWDSTSKVEEEEKVPSLTVTGRPLYPREVGWSGEWAGAAHNNMMEARDAPRLYAKNIGSGGKPPVPYSTFAVLIIQVVFTHVLYLQYFVQFVWSHITPPKIYEKVRRGTLASMMGPEGRSSLSTASCMATVTLMKKLQLCIGLKAVAVVNHLESDRCEHHLLAELGHVWMLTSLAVMCRTLR
ncbi:hypothetical protein K438DRAFT_1772203 [Mycena galopus ATCC 62051]|nr:hypothetical protein K438DRAFT_1772203 [Mycena galopus ATCC 62051]